MSKILKLSQLTGACQEQREEFKLRFGAEVESLKSYAHLLHLSLTSTGPLRIY